jgi:hypothetical protein
MVKIYGAGGLRGLEAYQSGFLISPQGHVLTAWSYVLDTDFITVTLADGRKFQGRLGRGRPPHRNRDSEDPRRGRAVFLAGSGATAGRRRPRAGFQQPVRRRDGRRTGQRPARQRLDQDVVVGAARRVRDALRRSRLRAGCHDQQSGRGGRRADESARGIGRDSGQGTAQHVEQHLAEPCRADRCDHRVGRRHPGRQDPAAHRRGRDAQAGAALDAVLARRPVGSRTCCPRRRRSSMP